MTDAVERVAVLIRRCATAAVVFTQSPAEFPHLLSKMLSDEKPFILTHSPAEQSFTIEQVRDLQASLAYHFSGSEKREIVLTHADQVTIPAQQALLKTLEEPPDNTRIWLVTSNPAALLDTVRSRCIYVDVSMLTNESKTSQTDDSFVRSRAGDTKSIDMAALFPRNVKSYADLSAIATTFPDRTAARNWLEMLIENRGQLGTRGTQLAVQALDDLRSNGNVKLVVEHCLFAMKALLPTGTTGATGKGEKPE